MWEFSETLILFQGFRKSKVVMRSPASSRTSLYYKHMKEALNKHLH